MDIAALSQSQLFTLAQGCWTGLYQARMAEDYQAFRARLSEALAQHVTEPVFRQLQISENMMPFDCIRRGNEVAVMLSDKRSGRLAQLVLRQRGEQVEVVQAQLG